MNHHTDYPYSDQKHVTTGNLETIRESLPSDQADELQPGCISWRIREGAITVWPSEGRAAVCTGGDSDWGDYTGTPGDDDFTVRLDVGVVVGSDGVPLTNHDDDLEAAMREYDGDAKALLADLDATGNRLKRDA